MICLMAYYLIASVRRNKVFFVALFMACVADLLLLGQDEMSFIAGLGCFLIMQLLYVYVFYCQRDRSENRSMPWVIIGALFIYAFALLSFLWNDLHDMKLPVILYTLSITGMVLFAFGRDPKLLGYRKMIFGVILFVLSDSIIAINRFGQEIAYADVYIMATYMLAQFLIVNAYLKSESRAS